MSTADAASNALQELINDLDNSKTDAAMLRGELNAREKEIDELKEKIQELESQL